MGFINKDTLTLDIINVNKVVDNKKSPIEGAYVKLTNGNEILEYGCGIAPISHSLLKVSLKRNLNITIADIRQINFHYAIHRLGKNVEHFEIVPFENSIQKSKYNIVFMITVMEHLPDPLDTVKNITNMFPEVLNFIENSQLGKKYDSPLKN